jgi:hypothetical protein
MPQDLQGRDKSPSSSHTSDSFRYTDTCRTCYVEPVGVRRYRISPSLQIPMFNVRFLVVLLIRTYAFFNRNVYLLSFLSVCLSGLVAYQLYVATSQMECKGSVTISRRPLIPNSAPVYQATTRPLSGLGTRYTSDLLFFTDARSMPSCV